jgi:hypothetical protein
MGDFSFTATAECHYCGNLLGSSDDECENCSDDDREQHVFRKMDADDGPIETIMVEATMRYKWYKLHDEIGDDWIAYEWLGPRPSVQRMLEMDVWDTLQDIPQREMSLDAPNDVDDSDE